MPKGVINKPARVARGVSAGGGYFFVVDACDQILATIDPHERLAEADAETVAEALCRAVNGHSEGDLLEAAKFYVANCSQRSRHNHDRDCDGPMCGTFRAAIAKAEGRPA